jgi:hypothetical protein
VNQCDISRTRKNHTKSLRIYRLHLWRSLTLELTLLPISGCGENNFWNEGAHPSSNSRTTIAFTTPLGKSKDLYAWGIHTKSQSLTRFGSRENSPRDESPEPGWIEVELLRIKEQAKRKETSKQAMLVGYQNAKAKFVARTNQNSRQKVEKSLRAPRSTENCFPLPKPRIAINKTLLEKAVAAFSWEQNTYRLRNLRKFLSLSTLVQFLWGRIQIKKICRGRVITVAKAIKSREISIS